MTTKGTGCLARSSRAICFAVARSKVIKFPLSAVEDTSPVFAWGAFIARFHIEKRGYWNKRLSRSPFELLRDHLLRDPDAGFLPQLYSSSPFMIIDFLLFRSTKIGGKKWNGYLRPKFLIATTLTVIIIHNYVNKETTIYK